MTLDRKRKRTPLRGRKTAVPEKQDPLPYHSRGYLLTQEEQLFVRSLHPAAQLHRLAIYAKPRLADVLNCNQSDWRAGHGELRGKRHVDFVLCSDIARIEVGVELDDPSHAHRAHRDDFLDRAFEAAGISLLRFPVQQRYDTDRIAEAIGAALASG